MRRQPRIVVRLLDQVLRAAPLVVKPDQEGDGLAQVGHEDSILVRAGFEQLVLLAFLRLLFFAGFLVAQGHEPIGLLPPVRLIAKFTLPSRIRLGRRLPLGLTQWLDQPRRLARRNHELGIEFFVGLHRLPAVESCIGPAENLLHARWQGRTHFPYMIADLLAGGPIAVAQFAPEVFPRFGDKRQHRLVAPLAFVLGVVALASAHLLAVKRVHGGVGVQGDDLQLHIGRRPDPFAQGSHKGQNLPGDIPMQRIHESPEGGLHRQLGDFQDARQNRVTGDEAQLVQPRKADVEPQYDSQHEPVQIHGTGNSLRCHRLFPQGLKAEFFQHGDHRQQPAVRSQVLTGEVIRISHIMPMILRS